MLRTIFFLIATCLVVLPSLAEQRDIFTTTCEGDIFRCTRPPVLVASSVDDYEHEVEKYPLPKIYFSERDEKEPLDYPNEDLEEDSEENELSNDIPDHFHTEPVDIPIPYFNEDAYDNNEIPTQNEQDEEEPLDYHNEDLEEDSEENELNNGIPDHFYTEPVDIPIEDCAEDAYDNNEIPPQIEQDEEEPLDYPNEDLEEDSEENELSNAIPDHFHTEPVDIPMPYFNEDAYDNNEIPTQIEYTREDDDESKRSKEASINSKPAHPKLHSSIAPQLRNRKIMKLSNVDPKRVPFILQRILGFKL